MECLQKNFINMLLKGFKKHQQALSGLYTLILNLLASTGVGANPRVFDGTLVQPSADVFGRTDGLSRPPPIVKM